MTDLERMSQFKEKLISLMDCDSNMIKNYVYEKFIDNNYYEEERKYFIKKYSQKFPYCIRASENLNKFISILNCEMSNLQNKRLFVKNTLMEFLDFLEFGEIIQSEKISSENLDNSLSIILEKELFEHIQKLLKSEHYFEAIIESYKFCIAKLTQITG